MALANIENSVVAHVDNMKQTADAAIAAADTFLSDLKGTLIGQPPFFTPNQPSLDVAALAIDAEPPTRPEISTGDIGLPGLPTVETTIDEEAPDRPDMSIEEIKLPELPPVETKIDEEAPDRPEISTEGLEIPELTNFAIPEIIDIPIPVPPTRTPVGLNAEFVFSEEGYVSDLLTDVKNRLHLDMQEGGVGLNQNIEDGYWTRKKERDEVALSEARQKLASQWGRSRFKLPTGALNAALLDLEEKAMLSRMDSSRDIAIKQVELALNNKQFAITNTIALEQITLQHYHNLMDRALRAAISVAEFGINLYNAKRNEFKDEIELYKGQIEGVNLQYQGQNLKMEGAKTKAEIETQRLQAYKTRAEAFMDKIRALTAVYAADTDVYKAKIGKGTAEAELKLKHADLTARHDEEVIKLAIEKVRSLTSIYAADMDAYKVEVDKKVKEVELALKKTDLTARHDEEKVTVALDKIRALTAIYAADMDAYRIEIDKGAKEAEIKLKQADLTVRYADGNMQLAIMNARANLEAFVRMQDVKIGTITTGGKIYEQRAAAAMQALNTIIQLGYTGTKVE